MTVRAAIFALAAVGAGCAAHPSAQSAAIPVRLESARSERFSTGSELAGSIVATRTVTLGAASAGRIVAVTVNAGDRVSAGDVVAQVDSAAYSAQLEGARAGATAASDNERAARAQLSGASSRLELAQTTARRMAQLYEQGAISHQQEDEAQASLSAARAAWISAQASASAAAGLAAQARADVAAAAVPLDDTKIAAPFDAVITQKFVEPGAVVGAGSPVVALQDTRDLELDVALPEGEVAEVPIGAPLRVRVDALGAATIPARVRAIVPSENAALRSATLRISIAPHPGLLPGMFARVTVPGKTQRAIGVPAAALATRAGQTGVFVVRNETAAFVPVRSGIVDRGRIEVDGLSAGERVATSNVEQLTDGARVTVEDP